MAGNALAQDHTWAFTTAAPPATGCTLTGTANAETISGTSGDDVICADGGNDTIRGLSGNDTLKGEAGNDILLGGVGNDALDGGLGTDTGSYSASLTAVVASLATNSATGEGSDTFLGVENLLGSPKADALTGSAANNRLTGGGAADTELGRSGSDTVIGSGGPDTLKGEDGNDTVNSKDGVNGNDSLDGGGGHRHESDGRNREVGRGLPVDRGGRDRSGKRVLAMAEWGTPVLAPIRDPSGVPESVFPSYTLDAGRPRPGVVRDTTRFRAAYGAPLLRSPFDLWGVSSSGRAVPHAGHSPQP